MRHVITWRIPRTHVYPPRHYATPPSSLPTSVQTLLPVLLRNKHTLNELEVNYSSERHLHQKSIVCHSSRRNECILYHMSIWIRRTYSMPHVLTRRVPRTYFKPDCAMNHSPTCCHHLHELKTKRRWNQLALADYMIWLLYIPTAPRRDAYQPGGRGHIRKRIGGSHVL